MIQYYLKWFYKLKKELWDVYRIRIEDISNFAKVISEFEHHNYDAYQIISEYSRLSSVRNEIIIKETHIATLEQKERSLNGNIVSLESRLYFVNHRMEIYEGLEAIGFEIKELGQLHSLFVEISDANNIPLREAGSKFFKDIKEQYDCKLGFELDIEEHEEKLGKNKNEFPNSI